MVADTRPWQFSWRTAGSPPNLTFDGIVNETEFGHSRRAQMATGNRGEIACWRLHLNLANWNHRSMSNIPRCKIPTAKLSHQEFIHPWPHGRVRLFAPSALDADWKVSGEHRNAPDPEALWNILNPTPAGRSTNWYPKLDYLQ